MDIICISTTDWDEILGGRQQIMSRLASSGHRVLFIGRQVGPEHLLRDSSLRKRKIISWRSSAINCLAENLWTCSPPLLTPGRYYSQFMNQLGQSWLARFIHRSSRALNFQPGLLWIYPPHSAPLIDKVPHQLSVYHCVDRFAGNQKGLKRRILDAQETQLLQRADLIFASGKGLQMQHQKVTNKPIILIPNGADIAHFQSTDLIHPEVMHIPHPRLGVMGTFDARIDVNMLTNLAHQRPDWHLILIGQIRPGRVNLEPLLNLANVHYLGSHPFQELPMLLNGMDVLLIPYVLNELTQFINPLKLYEYLAIGAPVVSVPLPEVLPLNNHVHIADSHEFVQAIHTALESDTAEMHLTRRELAKQFGWDTRVQQMMSIIDQHSSNTTA